MTKPEPLKHCWAVDLRLATTNPLWIYVIYGKVVGKVFFILTLDIGGRKVTLFPSII